MGNAYISSDDGPPPGRRELLAMGGFSAMAALCLFELLILLPRRFQQRSGTYFWSLVTAYTGAVLFNIGIILYNYVLHHKSPWIYTIFVDIGYLLYIPGEYYVLYSRLHLLSPSRRMTQAFFVIMVTEVLLITVPLAVISTVAQVITSKAFAEVYQDFAEVEIIAYAVTESILSGIYIFQVFEMWHKNGSLEMRRLLKHLIMANLFIILMQAINVTLEFADQAAIGSTWLCFMYAFQLKMEFWVLNQLTDISRANLNQAQAHFSETTGFEDRVRSGQGRQLKVHNSAAETC